MTAMSGEDTNMTVDTCGTRMVVNFVYANDDTVLGILYQHANICLWCNQLATHLYGMFDDLAHVCSWCSQFATHLWCPPFSFSWFQLAMTAFSNWMCVTQLAYPASVCCVFCFAYAYGHTCIYLWFCLMTWHTFVVAVRSVCNTLVGPTFYEYGFQLAKQAGFMQYRYGSVWCLG